MFILIAAIAATVLYLMGGQTHKFETEVTIAAPPDLVFAYLTESDKIRAWMPNIESIEPLTDEGHKEGAKARIIINEHGTQFELTDQVLRTVPNEELLTLASSDMFQTRSSYKLTKESIGETNNTLDSGTRLSATVSVTHKSYYRVIAPFLNTQMKPQLLADLIRLQEVVERDYENSINATPNK